MKVEIMTEEHKEVPKSGSEKPTEGEMVDIMPVEGWEVPFDESLVRFHEAAHAVGARPNDVDQAVLGGCGYSRWPKARRPVDEFRLACLSMTGPYAAWRKARRETMPRVPFGMFASAAEVQPNSDIGRALDRLRRTAEGGGGEVEEVYEAMCLEVVRWVEVSWLEIGAVAARLREHACLRSWEVHRPIWKTRGVPEPPTDRPFGDLLEQWDKDEVELWKSPGGWLWELMDDTVPSTRIEPEDEGGGFLLPGL